MKTAAVLGLAYLLALPGNAYRTAQVVPPYESLLEYSWMSDMHSQLVAGRWAGRDFIYTYGPLRQVLHSAGALVGPGDLATSLRFDRALVSALGVAGVWWLLKKTDAAWNWRAVLLLAWFGCDFELHTKPLAAILIAAAFGRSLATSGAAKPLWQRVLACIAWASAAPLAMLYCFDLGVAIGVWLPIFVGVILLASLGRSSTAVSATRRRAILMLGSALIGAAVFAGLLYALPGWQRYVHDSWLVAAGYLTQMAYPLSGVHACILAAGGIVALLMLAYAIRRLRELWQSQQAVGAAWYEQVAVACLALPWLRYGLTRSDPLHVLDAVLPVIFWWGCLVPAEWSARWQNRTAERGRWYDAACWVLPALLLAKLMIAPETTVVSWTDRWQVFTRPAPASIVMDDASQRAVAAARELPEEMLIVWPNESFLAQAAGKVNPTYTLQSFMAMNPALEQATIDRYERLGNTPVLLVRLGDSLDSVSHVSRAPAVFRYLIEHFELSADSNPEFAILNRSATPGRGWKVHEIPLPDGGIIAKLTEGGIATIRLDGENDDVRASDLLLLDASTSWLPLSPTGKAARLLIKLTLDSGQHQIRFVPLAQGEKPQRIGLSYLEPADSMFVDAYFGTVTTRASGRITKLEIAWQPVDFLTPLPDELVIHHLEYLRRDGAPAKTIPVNASPRLRVNR